MPNNFPINNKGFNPFGELIGLKFSRTEKGTSRCTLEVIEKLLNPHNVVHGGVIYSMADTGMGVALYTELGENESCTTIEIKIVYFKAVTSGVVTCETKVVHKSKRIAILESEISNYNHVIAKATGTFYVLRRGAQ
ncbi:MAG: PaaI family thioesterase [bacterium]